MMAMNMTAGGCMVPPLIMVSMSSTAVQHTMLTKGMRAFYRLPLMPGLTPHRQLPCSWQPPPAQRGLLHGML